MASLIERFALADSPFNCWRGGLHEGAVLSGHVLPRLRETAPEPKYPDYAIEILNQSGSMVVNEKGLLFYPESGFTILLSRQLLPAGEYRIKVYGLGRGAKTSVAETVLRLRYKQ